MVNDFLQMQKSCEWISLNDCRKKVIPNKGNMNEIPLKHFEETCKILKKIGESTSHATL